MARRRNNADTAARIVKLWRLIIRAFVLWRDHPVVDLHLIFPRESRRPQSKDKSRWGGGPFGGGGISSALPWIVGGIISNIGSSSGSSSSWGDSGGGGGFGGFGGGGDFGGGGSGGSW